MPTKGRSHGYSPNGEATGVRKVPASWIFRRTSQDGPEEIQEREDGGGPNGQAPPGGAARPGGNDADLARKLAWAVGSSFAIPYGRKSAIHAWFEEHADQMLIEMGLRGP